MTKNKKLQINIEQADYFDWNLDSLELSDRFESTSFCLDYIAQNKGQMNSWNSTHNFSSIGTNVWVDNAFWSGLFEQEKKNENGFKKIITTISEFLNQEKSMTRQKEIFEKTDLINIILELCNYSSMESLKILFNFRIFNSVFLPLYSSISSLKIVTNLSDREKFKESEPFDITAATVSESVLSIQAVEKIKNFIINSTDNDLYFINSDKLNRKWFAPSLGEEESINLIMQDMKKLEPFFYQMASYPLAKSECSSLEYMMHALAKDKKQDAGFLFKLNAAIMREDTLTRAYPVHTSPWLMYTAYAAPSFVDFFSHITDFFKLARSENNKAKLDKAHVIMSDVYEAYYMLLNQGVAGGRDKFLADIKSRKKEFLEHAPEFIEMIAKYRINDGPLSLNQIINDLIDGDKKTIISLIEKNLYFALHLNLKNLASIDDSDFIVKTINTINSCTNKLPQLPPQWMDLQTWLKVTDFTYFNNHASEADIKQFQRETGLLKNAQFISHLIDVQGTALVYYAMKTFSSHTKNKELMYQMALSPSDYVIDINPVLLEDTDFLLEMIKIFNHDFMHNVPAVKWQDDKWVKTILEKIDTEKLNPTLYLPHFLLSSLGIEGAQDNTELLSKFDTFIEKRALIQNLNSSESTTNSAKLIA